MASPTCDVGLIPKLQFESQLLSCSLNLSNCLVKIFTWTSCSNFKFYMFKQLILIVHLKIFCSSYFLFFRSFTKQGNAEHCTWFLLPALPAPSLRFLLWDHILVQCSSGSFLMNKYSDRASWDKENLSLSLSPYLSLHS